MYLCQGNKLNVKVIKLGFRRMEFKFQLLSILGRSQLLLIIVPSVKFHLHVKHCAGCWDTGINKMNKTSSWPAGCWESSLVCCGGSRKLSHHSSMALCLHGRIHGTNETPREPNFTPLQQVSLAIEVKPSLKLHPLMLRLVVAVAWGDTPQMYIGFVPHLNFSLRCSHSARFLAEQLLKTSTRNIASCFRETLLITSRTFLQIYFSFSPWGVGLVALYSPHSSWSAPQENQKQEKAWEWAIFVPCKEGITESFQCYVISRRPLEPQILPWWRSHIVELY